MILKHTHTHTTECREKLLQLCLFYSDFHISYIGKYSGIMHLCCSSHKEKLFTLTKRGEGKFFFTIHRTSCTDIDKRQSKELLHPYQMSTCDILRSTLSRFSGIREWKFSDDATARSCFISKQSIATERESASCKENGCGWKYSLFTYIIFTLLGLTEYYKIPVVHKTLV